MKKIKLYFILLPIMVILILIIFNFNGLLIQRILYSASSQQNTELLQEVELPTPRYKGKFSVEEAIFQRRSRRKYKKEAITLKEISQILWAAAGSTVDVVTGATRTVPSAGACYPIETYLIVGKVKELATGIYHYNWQKHSLTLIVKGDVREELAKAALGQKMIKEAPVSLVFTIFYPRTTRRYGERGVRYAHIDTGCVIQNVYLQAEALNLGTVCIGAFFDEKVKNILGIKDEQPLCIMPLGKIKR